MTISKIKLAASVLVAGLMGPASVYAQAKTVTLDEAVDLGLRVHPSIVQARGQVRNAMWSQRTAFGSWLPSLSFSSGWSQNSSTRFNPNTQLNVSGSSTSYSVAFSSSVELFDGFRRVNQNRAANATATSADAAYVNQEFQVVLQIKQAFFSALAADQLVGVSETRIDRAQEQLQITRDKLAAGTGIRSDTLRSTVELGNAELQRLSSETLLATAEANLARLIGIDGPVGALADSALLRPIELDTFQLRTQARQASPLVQEAVAQESVARANLAVARAQFFPTLSASGNYSWAGQEVNSLQSSWTIRLGFSLPIFNGLTRESNVARNSVALDNAVARADDARRQVDAEFTQYFASLASAQARFRIAEASFAAAEEDLRIQRTRVDLGAATIVDVLTLQVSLDQAAVDRVQALFDYLVAKAQIEALIGREL